jgi:hypothetical protein
VKSLVENFSWEDGKIKTNWLAQYKVISERNKNTTKVGDVHVGDATLLR